MRLLAALGLIAAATLTSYVIDRSYLAKFDDRRDVSEALNKILATTSDQLVYLTEIRDAIGPYIAADDRNGLQRSLPTLREAVATLRIGVAEGTMAPRSWDIMRNPLISPLTLLDQVIESGETIARDETLWGEPAAYNVSLANAAILEARPLFRRIREIENADLDRLAARMEHWRKGGVAIVFSLLLVVWCWNFRPLLGRLRAERAALKAQWQRAEDASAAKSTFISTLSHEIRTPLVGILGAAELLRDGTDDPNRNDLAATILTSGRSLLAVLSDILEFTKVEAGRIEIVEAPVDLGAMADEIRGLFRSNACARGLTLGVETSGPLAPAYVTDGGRLRQVLINLVGNAVKFTDEGSISIRLAARASAPGRHSLRIEVEDTGIGISEDETAAMFEAFRQANGSAERRHEGTGLGLAIARRLAEALGGTLTVVSRPGAGSTFTLALDLAVSAPVPGRAGFRLRGSGGNRGCHDGSLRRGGPRRGRQRDELDDRPADVVEDGLRRRGGRERRGGHRRGGRAAAGPHHDGHLDARHGRLRGDAPDPGGPGEPSPPPEPYRRGLGPCRARARGRMPERRDGRHPSETLQPQRCRDPALGPAPSGIAQAARPERADARRTGLPREPHPGEAQPAAEIVHPEYGHRRERVADGAAAQERGEEAAVREHQRRERDDQ